MTETDFSDFTDEDVEMAVELGALVKADGQREVREYIRGALTDDCEECE